MGVNFLQNNDNLRPRDEVHIEALDVTPHADGRRLKVGLEVTPFREQPNFEIALVDAAGRNVGGTTIISAMTFRMEFTLHLRGVADPTGDYTLHAALYYDDPDAPQDTAETAFHVPAPGEEAAGDA